MQRSNSCCRSATQSLAASKASACKHAHVSAHQRVLRPACSTSGQQVPWRQPSPPPPPAAEQRLRQQEQQAWRHPQAYQQHHAADRRSVLARLAAIGVAAVPAARAAGAPAAAAAATATPQPASPLPVPPLTETFISAEGFAFDYPAGWVVAFDRSGSTGNGAVVVVGDFRALITVSVFRTITIPEAIVRAGLSQEAGYEICVEPQQRQGSTQRFELLRSAMAPPATANTGAAGEGASLAQSAAAARGAYEFEYKIETCVGEVEEGLGGTLRCLGPFGNVIPTQQRRHIGRCVLVGNTAFSLNGSSPEDRWTEVGPILRAVVGTFRGA